MGNLYDHNGKEMMRVPICSFEDGKVKDYATLYENIKATYSKGKIYNYPSGIISTPIATYEKREDRWYIFKYGNSLIGSAYGYIKENGEIYSSCNNSIIASPIGYFEGDDYPGACAAAFIMFFYNKPISDNDDKHTKLVSSTTYNTNTTSGSYGGGDVPLFVYIIGVPIFIFLIWAFVVKTHWILIAIDIGLLIMFIIECQAAYENIKNDKVNGILVVLFLILGFIGAYVEFLIVGIIGYISVCWRSGFSNWFRTYYELPLLISSILTGLNIFVYGFL